MGRCYGLENIFSKQKAINKRQCKPVCWNGIEFESLAKLGRYLGCSNSGYIGHYIKQKKLIKGHLAEFITKEK